jgi:uncharacterized membrane protein YccC
MANRRKPKWGYDGRVEVVPFHFGEEHKKEIQNNLGTSFAGDRTQALISDLEKEIAEFVAHEKHETEQPRRAEVKAALEELENYASELAQRLEALDASTRHIIAIQIPLPIFLADESVDVEYHNHIEFLADALADFRRGIVRALDDKLSLLPSAKPGPLKRPARRTFAWNVVCILADHTKKQPTTTRDGLYESILRICLSAATGESVSDVHDLAMEAMKKRDKVE